MINPKYMTDALDTTKTINMIEGYLEGDVISEEPQFYYFRAKNCHTDNERSILIRDILIDNWHKTPDKNKIYIVRKINEHIANAQEITKGFPPDVKKVFTNKYAALNLALFGDANFDCRLLCASCNIMSLADEILYNRLEELSPKTDKFYRIKMRVAEAMEEYIKSNGILHTRTAAAIRIINIDAITYENYIEILNAELSSLLIDSHTSALAKSLIIIMDKENVLNSLTASKESFNAEEFNQFISQMFLGFMHAKENLCKQPLYFISKHFLKVQSKDEDRFSAQEKENVKHYSNISIQKNEYSKHNNKFLIMEVSDAGELGHAFLKCKTKDDYQFFLKKLEFTKKNLKNIEPEFIALINKIEKLINATLPSMEIPAKLSSVLPSIDKVKLCGA